MEGSTVDYAAVYFGSKLFAAGQAYVALSRVISLEGLLIEELDCSKLIDKRPCHNDAFHEMNRLETCPAITKNSSVNPTPLAHADTQRDNHPRGGYHDRRTSCPCHHEFRGPRSDYVRQCHQLEIGKPCFFTYTYKKKSKSVTSGDLGGHGIERLAFYPSVGEHFLISKPKRGDTLFMLCMC
ncbi:ATP-dependent DNA helicase [Trichonephila clavipes]|nr:ATP-dependent DNA helicase [Trichonephila clavipes]